MKIKNLLFNVSRNLTLENLGLLLFRAFAGLSMITHGYPKFRKIIANDLTFPDPIGMGPALSLYSVTFAELICAALLTIGLFSRLSTLPLIFAMSVAAFVHHAPDPYAQKELALLYLAAYVILLITGPGKISLDALITKKTSKSTN